ncbi:unnamed protein product [Rhizoctonia solani]|uniref:Uncharacterized protein n=1 Tax=Rhizoctonia solani TaxID=456999 RepID=A0A8H3DGE7_9AGAM|nr:unnamed protein product [Rhizoctonia solani]
MVHSSQFISGLSLPGGQLVDRMEAMVIEEPNASSSSAAGSSVSGSSARNSRTSSTTSLSACSDSQTQTQTPRRSSSFRRPSFSKVKHQVASAGVKFAASMVSLPIIGELLEGVCDSVRDYENMGSNRHGLAELEQRVEAILNMLNSEPQLLTTDREYAHFTDCIQNLHIEVNSELQVGLVRRLDAATRLDEFNRELTDLLANAIKAGHIVQKRVVVPEEFDSTIPSLKIVNERNGLVIREHISTRRYDGTSVNDTRDQLHVYTYQAMYNDVAVEVEDYCGGPDDYLAQTLTELVDDYNQRGLNPVLQRLHGGSVFKDQTGRLHAYLVLSPREGTPWVKLVKAKQSIELLCQVAEKTATVFKQLKQNKQMNFDDIRVRSDGTLLLVPHTEGDNFLLDEDVFDPSDIGGDGEYEIGWPFDDLCRLLHESSKQGLVPEAVAALREHDGTWDQIAVWRVGRDIGLRPPPSSRAFNCYPAHHWTINPGWIIHWPEPGSMPSELDGCFNPVVKLPKSMIEEEYEQQHLTSFMIKTAMGKRGDECINYFNQDRGEAWLLPAQEKDWESCPLEPWQGVESITLHYESVRLELVEWTEWKRALKIAAQKKDLAEEDLGVVNRTDVLITIDKQDIPELGTRPIYFYRRKPGADTSPQQFWGFFTFNQDPLGPTGLTVRCSGPNQRGRIVSESLPPDPSEYEQKWINLEIEIEYVNMCDDWSLMIEQQREYNRRHKMAPRYSEETLEWSDWEMDVDQV